MIRSTALFVALLVATIQGCAASSVHDGSRFVQYRRNHHYQKDLFGEASQVRIIEPVSSHEETQTWVATHDGFENTVFRNKKSGLYVSYQDPHYPCENVVLSEDLHSWRLGGGAAEGGFFTETVEQYQSENLIIDGIPVVDSRVTRTVVERRQRGSHQAWHSNSAYYSHERQIRHHRMPYKRASLCFN